MKSPLAQVAEWLMAADCKSAAPSELRRFESSPVHQDLFFRADVAQLVEHSLGKGEVTGSIPVISSRVLRRQEALTGATSTDDGLRKFELM